MSAKSDLKLAQEAFAKEHPHWGKTYNEDILYKDEYIAGFLAALKFFKSISNV